MTRFSRIHEVGQASRLSLTSKNFRLSGWNGFGFAALCGVWILRRWRQARRLSYAGLFAACAASTAWIRLQGITGIVAGAILACVPVTTGNAAVPIAPELQAAEDGGVRQIQLEAEISLQEKIQAGKQRHQERQAFRQALVAGMRSEAAERREEVAGRGPTAVAKPEKRFEMTDAVWALLVLLAVYHGYRFHQKRQLEDIVFSLPAFDQESLPKVKAIERKSPDDDWKQIVHSAHLAAEHGGGNGADADSVGKVNFAGTVNCTREKLLAIHSVKVCVNVSAALKVLISEDRIKEHLQLLLEGQGIQTKEDSKVWLALVVQGSHNEKTQTFTHREKLVFVESETLFKKNLITRQLTPHILWGAEYTGFAREREVENDILSVVQVIAEMFGKELLAAREPEPLAQPATLPPDDPVAETAPTEKEVFVVATGEHIQ